MTREEQIEMLKEEYEDCAGDDSYTQEWLETLDSAIKALEQEPCEDAVSRKEVINQIFYSTDNNGDVVLGSALRERIARLPSVTPQEPRWIPIDEKRPSGFEKVLVTYRLHCDDSIHVGFGGIECNLFNGKYYWDINEQVIGWHVLAWMPLPEPYEGGE